MGQYRKRPAVIEAVQLTKVILGPAGKWDAEFSEELPDWMREAIGAGENQSAGGIWPAPDGRPILMVGTLESPHEASEGDWIIRGIKGELYPCKPDIFEATYLAEAGTRPHSADRGPAVATDISTIDAVSFATRVGQSAAAELYALLSSDADFPLPTPFWFNPTKYDVAGDDETLVDLSVDMMSGIEALGLYVCSHQVDQGERLYRWGGDRGIVPPGNWTDLDFAGRQAFETFVDTVRNTYVGLAVAQKAIEDTRRSAGVKPPSLKLEDSIFEEEEPLGKLRDEAIAAAPLQQRYLREAEAEAARIRAAEEKAAQDNAERERGRFNGADPNKFDHDGDGKPGGSRKRPPAPPPVSAGETVPATQRNRGGRGRRKQA